LHIIASIDIIAYYTIIIDKVCQILLSYRVTGSSAAAFFCGPLQGFGEQNHLSVFYEKYTFKTSSFEGFDIEAQNKCSLSVEKEIEVTDRDFIIELPGQEESRRAMDILMPSFLTAKYYCRFIIDT